MINLVDRRGDKLCRVEWNSVNEAGWEIFGHSGHGGSHTFGGIQSVRLGQLVDRDSARNVAVYFEKLTIGARPEFDSPDVPNTRDESTVIRVEFDDDVLKSLDRRKVSFDVEHQLEWFT